jgi:hypothetical protein
MDIHHGGFSPFSLRTCYDMTGMMGSAFANTFSRFFFLFLVSFCELISFVVFAYSAWLGGALDGNNVSTFGIGTYNQH